MSNFFKVLQHLLPNGRAWLTTTDKPLRRLVDGLSKEPENVKGAADDVYDELLPATTNSQEEWEFQFGLLPSILTPPERRQRIDAEWKAQGGQDPDYIQSVLQAAGFDVYVHEFWEPIAGRSGGSVNGDVTPVVRNPFDYLWDGASPREYFAGVGHENAVCGGSVAFCNSQLDPPGYPLVNILQESTTTVIGVGSSQALCGGTIAACGAQLTEYRRKQYVMPPDPETYPYYLYIGAEEFPLPASVPQSRRDEFERLCLKICPLGNWLGIIVTYS